MPKRVERLIMVLELLAPTGQMTSADLAEALGVSTTYVERDLVALISIHLVEVRSVAADGRPGRSSLQVSLTPEGEKAAGQLSEGVVPIQVALM